MNKVYCVPWPTDMWKGITSCASSALEQIHYEYSNLQCAVPNIFVLAHAWIPKHIYNIPAWKTYLCFNTQLDRQIKNL